MHLKIRSVIDNIEIGIFGIFGIRFYIEYIKDQTLKKRTIIDQPTYAKSVRNLTIPALRLLRFTCKAQFIFCINRSTYICVTNFNKVNNINF